MKQPVRENDIGGSPRISPGAWIVVCRFRQNGDLGEHRAEDEDSSTTKDTYWEKYTRLLGNATPRRSLSTGDTITFTYADGKLFPLNTIRRLSAEAGMTRARFAAVRYQFETTSADAPKYVQFNDHGHEPGEAHFHITSATTASMP